MNNFSDDFINEIKQLPARRATYLRDIAKHFNANIILLFIPQRKMLTNQLSKVLELKLSEFKEEKDLILIMNGPGGDAHAAEVIINSCRAYVKRIKKSFSTLVMTNAMSALTIIALGSDKIIMTNSSYLGPIDPIIFTPKLDNNGRPIVLPNGEMMQESFPAYSLIQAYDNLKNEFKNDKNNQAILMELSKFDPKMVEHIRQIFELSKDIAKKFLESGMFKNNKDKIEKVIEFFTNPKETRSHGRPLFASDNTEKGLEINIEIVAEGTDIWENLQKLYLSAQFFTEANNAWIIESSE